ncbi:MAG: class I SAM-dependent methyltransferase, partial [Planctomycetota bacterium]
MTTLRRPAVGVLASIVSGLLLTSCGGKPPIAGKGGPRDGTSPRASAGSRRGGPQGSGEGGDAVGHTGKAATSGSAARAPDAKALAREILDSTGVKGGLVVHVGCGDGKLTAALGEKDGFLVHGLDRSEEKVTAARKYIQGLGLYGGKISIGRLEGERLPYVDNLVNLLVVEALERPAREEVLRVLSPQGVAYIRSGRRSEKIVKPRPREMD